MNKFLISIVIPIKNEEESIEKLYLEIIDVVKKNKINYQIVFVDDGSTDKSYQILEKLHKLDKKIKIVKLRGWFGKSIALQAGFENSNGEIIITMDADLQDNPIEIPKLMVKGMI